MYNEFKSLSFPKRGSEIIEKSKIKLGEHEKKIAEKTAHGILLFS